MKFPENFVWGVATASYQIEGAVDKDGRSESIWDRFSRTPGKVLNGDTGDVACDHYHLYKKDVALIKDLGVDSYRFSLAWPRIVPAGRGGVNQKGLDFYKRLIEELLSQGVAPAVTLYHWDLPQVLEDEGGWLNRDTAKYFADYAMVAFEELGDVVTSWITLNEPWCSAFLGYGNGEHAPGKKDFPSHLRAAHTLLLGHGLALQGYRQLNLPGEIGITLNLAPQYSASSNPQDLEATKKADGFQNRWYLDPIFKGSYPADMEEQINFVRPAVQPGDLELISQPNDFLGINFYSRGLVAADKNGQPQGQKPQRSVTAMGWEVYPEALYELLVRVHQDYGPIPLYVTENGAAYEDTLDEGRVRDTQRQSYLEQHFAQAAQAIEAGVPLKGYYVWSLLDNFEWAFGYDRRFGIIYVDFETQERILKDSALWYQSFLRR
ncbi:MAG TPA: GH1 family beta-glucosidase [Limnochordia bacterium]|nr:GH1 family beta-glucosidase [Limnochordia bacterium]